MFYFKSRSAARSFKMRNAAYRVIDGGADVPPHRRWGVRVV